MHIFLFSLVLSKDSSHLLRAIERWSHSQMSGEREILLIVQYYMMSDRDECKLANLQIDQYL